MRVAIVGGGINGVMCAWQAARAGHETTLFERGRLMRQTSAASSKLLHGGLRYLANGEFRLVREALRERRWWLENAPELAGPLELILPVYSRDSRPRWQLALGLTLYDVLSGGGLPTHRRLDRKTLLDRVPALRSEGLIGGFSFFDGAMKDDALLGLWAADQARKAGADLRENCNVEALSTEGGVRLAEEWQQYDRVINVGGPWARQLLDRSGISSGYDLDLVRGSHVIIDRPCTQALLVQDPGSARILFVLPYDGKTLFGTTEVRQPLESPCILSAEEHTYLQGVWTYYFGAPYPKESPGFAGLRPLLRSHANPTRATREYALERRDRLMTVFGGKWTTSRALAERVIQSLH